MEMYQDEILDAESFSFLCGVDQDTLPLFEAAATTQTSPMYETTSTDPCSQPERRWAPDDTGYYTKEEFVEYYGGTDEWIAADEQQQAPVVNAATSRRHKALAKSM